MSGSQMALLQAEAQPQAAAAADPTSKGPAQDIIVIGAGPVGLAIALLLCKQGHQVTVYEGRPEIPDNVEESYPIGINPRALHTLKEIDPELEASARHDGRIVNAWQIFGGERMVADLASGTVYGTTRGCVNRLLYQKASRTEGVTVVFNHKLADIRFETHELVFDKYGDGAKTQVVVPAGHARVLAADGVNSNARRAMERHGVVQSETKTWNSEFRVLFSKPGQGSKDLDPDVHYIFNGCYAAIVKQQGVETWTCVLGAKDTLLPQERDLVLSRDGSDANVKALRALLQKNCSRISPIIDDEELQRFFTRRSYRGAVVKVDKLNYGEWFLLMGDSAHSVLPPTGEGINSGLEDCTVLAQIMGQAFREPFAEYNARRLPDLDGLHLYASYLNAGLGATGPEAASRIMVTILQGIFKKWGVIKEVWEDFSFGPKSTLRRPYREIAAIWSRQIGCLHPVTRCICWGFYYVCLGPIFFPRRDADVAGLDRALKPPADRA